MTRVDLGEVTLESGATLPVTVEYRTYGTPNTGEDGTIDNAVLVLHALTGDADAATWWDGLIGPGRALDTDRWFVVSSNVLGGCKGTTGPSSPAPDGKAWGSRFPAITVRDQVTVEALLATHLGIDAYALVLGGSMGGMRVLEWLLLHPSRVRAAVVVAVGAAVTADQLGTQTTQVTAIRSDPAWRGGDYYDYGGPGPVSGLGLARRIAHLTYRSELELATRFGTALRPDGRYEVQSYLDHHAEKLLARFDAGSYVALTEAMNRHDVGRGRGGVAATLGTIEVPVLVAGVTSDRLYPLHLQQELADLIPTADGLNVIDSPYGHDGFLIEVEQVGKLVDRALTLTTR